MKMAICLVGPMRQRSNTQSSTCMSILDGKSISFQICLSEDGMIFMRISVLSLIGPEGRMKKEISILLYISLHIGISQLSTLIISFSNQSSKGLTFMPRCFILLEKNDGVLVGSPLSKASTLFDVYHIYFIFWSPRRPSIIKGIYFVCLSSLLYI